LLACGGGPAKVFQVTAQPLAQQLNRARDIAHLILAQGGPGEVYVVTLANDKQVVREPADRNGELGERRFELAVAVRQPFGDDAHNLTMQGDGEGGCLYFELRELRVG